MLKLGKELAFYCLVPALEDLSLSLLGEAIDQWAMSSPISAFFRQTSFSIPQSKSISSHCTPICTTSTILSQIQMHSEKLRYPIYVPF